MRILFKADHQIDVDVNTKRTYPKGGVYNVADDLAHQIVASGDAEYIDPDDAKNSAKAKPSEDDGEGEKLTKTKLMKLHKDQLLALAKELEVPHSEDNNKDEIVSAILKAQDEE